VYKQEKKKKEEENVHSGATSKPFPTGKRHKRR
jgi:hypothetical protein